MAVLLIGLTNNPAIGAKLRLWSWEGKGQIVSLDSVGVEGMVVAFARHGLTRSGCYRNTPLQDRHILTVGRSGYVENPG